MKTESQNILPPTAEARAKCARLEAILRGYGRLIVAYSGGVDSTFLSAVAARVLKENALAVTAQSESLAPDELEEARAYALQFGFAHEIVRTEELSDENYASNPHNRCYFCKSELMNKLVEIAQKRGYEKIALGATMDDLGDFRPGESAAAQRGAVFPLREAELGKAEIRSLSFEMGLPTWDKPGAACLSSRIPFGERVTAEKLAQIAAGESILHKAGFRECRLRHHGTIARIEVPPGQITELLAKSAEITQELKRLGFVYITLDLQGLRSGSLHEAMLQAKPIA
ncbi:MAG TPA: ATP-dependent sacrificial sulfur transferase LarE [Planctomycetota bacterium]|nr:ATP-dependent sacrificial sulfur transferase LarE [Planctomycetota bacterium]